MKNLAWTTVGIGNGLFFLFESGGQNMPLFALGTGLTALGVLAALDTLRAPAAQVSRLPALATDFVGAHVSRVKALYRLYQIAPVLLEKQERFEQSVHSLEILERQSLVWKRLATEAIFEQREQNRLSGAGKPEANAKIKFIAHSQQGGDLTKILAGQAAGTNVAAEKTIVVTDVGFSDVDANILEDALAGRIELDYWIAKKAMSGSDLLVLHGSLFQEKAGRVADLLEKMSARYDRVLVVAEFEQIALVEQSLLPDSQRILNAEII